MSNSLTGMLLVATPALKDPNFRRTILFVAAHSGEQGALAYILNRPCDSAMDLPGPQGPLSVPLFQGGPVQPGIVTLASLQWRSPSGVCAFHTFEEDSVTKEWVDGLRAFLGYAGWSPGQLEHELSQNAWLVIQPSRELVSRDIGQTAWMDIMRKAGPVMRLLAAAPDDPSLN
ncbi:MAG: YqgE/AlgH family protein [Terrimicrobiaceae bacterium]